MRGRPPTPRQLHVLRGNPGKRPLREGEPQVPAQFPPCPEILDEEARKEWDRLMTEAKALGIITLLDRGALAVYCQAWSQWCAAQEGIQKHGLLVKAPSGYPMQNPMVTIASKAGERMLQAASHLGLSPTARARLGVTRSKPSKTNSFKELTG